MFILFPIILYAEKVKDDGAGQDGFRPDITHGDNEIAFCDGLFDIEMKFDAEKTQLFEERNALEKGLATISGAGIVLIISFRCGFKDQVCAQFYEGFVIRIGGELGVLAAGVARIVYACAIG